MKMNSYKIQLLLLTVIVAFASSCKKYFDPPLVFEKEESRTAVKDRKVLLLVIDGLSGRELAKEVPATIKSLLPHAKYTFRAFSDANTGDASTWTSLLSGKNSANHGVFGNSFEEEIDEDDPHGNNSTAVEGFFTIYQRLLETGRTLKSLAVSDYAAMQDRLLGLADTKIVVNNDQLVRDSAVAALKRGPAELAFAVVNFRSVNDAGLQGGFSYDNASYKANLTTVDGYIAEVLAALKERKNYATEDWLVILTSNHGGLDNGYGGASMVEREIPMIFYNENFQETHIKDADVTNSLTLNNKGAAYITPTISATNSDLYDIKDGQEYTIMFKVKNYVKPTGSNHEVILGRTSHAYSANRGWHFMLEGAATGKYRALLGDGGAQLQIVGPTAGSVGTWETLALKIYNKSDGKRYATLYVDGVAGTEKDVTTDRKSFQTAANFILGSGNVTSIGTFNGDINNLVFVNKALTDEEIRNFNCHAALDDKTSYWGNVKGFWKADEGYGYKISNSAAGSSANTAFTFDKSTAAWKLQEQWNCLSDQDKKTQFVMNSTDAASQVYYWLNIQPAESWKLAGKVFLNNYETEFIK